MLTLVMSLFLLLGYGFMQVRIPPVGSAGIPVGEVVLLVSLMLINHLKLLPRLSATIFIAPFLIWWAFGLGRAAMNVSEYGVWALRDASHVIESLFLVVGFAFAASPRALDKFFYWLPRILIVVCIYALGYPFRETLQSVSPTLVAGSGSEVPLLFDYSSTGSLLLMAVVYLVLSKHRTGFGGNFAAAVAAFLLGYAVLLFQMRTIYLQIVALALLLALFRGKLKRGVIVVVLLLVGLPVVSAIGLQVEGRMGQAASIDFLLNHFLTLGGVESSGLEGSAGGVDLRIGWWLDLYQQWVGSLGNFFFGLGYGFPLVDFAYGTDGSEGVPIREPHNSYVSILARMGLVGGVAFAWMHVLLVGVWRRAYATCTRMRWREGQNRLLILMVFFVLVWIRALGEPAFELPFYTIPYYFFWGLVLQMSRHLSSWHETEQKRPKGSPETAISARSASEATTV
jgi:O-antigen ligase